MRKPINNILEDRSQPENNNEAWQFSQVVEQNYFLILILHFVRPQYMANEKKIKLN